MKPTLNFNHSPDEATLMELQRTLDANRTPGIVDIWVFGNPFYIVAEENGIAIGVASLNWGYDFCELYKLYVTAPRERSGIGRALFGEVVRLLKEKNVSELGVEMAEGTYPFWQKLSHQYQFDDFYENKFTLKL